MMPEIGNGAAVSGARNCAGCLSVYPLWGVARGTRA
ncbi:Uncharacterised protein [Escherichia coli]|uniref:Uncharacterized protein n=1 Tax=Escherichia coli TaxID=562 RepID=A0A376W882_ECOLX|nr:Uncharacterised protein [Escherichia coli]